MTEVEFKRMLIAMLVGAACVGLGMLASSIGKKVERTSFSCGVGKP